MVLANKQLHDKNRQPDADRAVFHFLADENERRRYVGVVKSALQERGYLVLATFALDGPEQCSGLPVERYDADKMQAVLGEAFTAAGPLGRPCSPCRQGATLYLRTV